MAKIKKWLKKKNLELVTELASHTDMTISAIARKMGISPSTFYYWMNEHEEFRNAFEEGRRTVDEDVESSFFKVCMGFKEVVKKPQKIKRTEFDERGRKIEYEEIVDVEEEVYIKPDVTAQKFYLTNRMPEKWKNETKDLAIGGDEANTGVVMLPEVEEPEEVVEAEIVENAE
jgi:transposase-like protein